VTNLICIFKAFQRTGTSVQKKRSVFEWPNLVRYLFYQIKNNNLLKERFSCFVVKDPKLREVFAPALKDRVLHHFLVDRLSPLLDKTLIFDSFANRPGKGTHGAVRRLQKMMRQGGPQQQWYLHADIAAYYTSISKPLLLRVIEKKINKIKNISWREKIFLVALCRNIVYQDPTKNPKYTGKKELLKAIPRHKSLFGSPAKTGLPIGSLTSQFFSNLFLDELDQYCKHKLKIKRYIRYVDDFVIVEDSAEKLLAHKKEIENFLKVQLKLQLHPKKIRIQKVNQGCDFLGFIVRPHFLLIRPRTLKAFKRRLAFFNWLLDSTPKVQSQPQSIPQKGKWARYLRQGLFRSGTRPDWELLYGIQQTLNAYWGLLGFCKSYHLKQQLYQNDFGLLKNYFISDSSFSKLRLRPLQELLNEGLLEESCAAFLSGSGKTKPLKEGHT
jgi:hypothetical protein